MTFILDHLIEIIFGLISAGALAFCRYMNKQMKEYKKLLEEKQDSELETSIEDHLKPLKQDIDGLKEALHKAADKEEADIRVIVSSYRFRLLQLCRQAINQGYITQAQYDQLTEFYKLYHSLGGNGQAQDYYDKAISLEIK